MPSGVALKCGVNLTFSKKGHQLKISKIVASVASTIALTLGTLTALPMAATAAAPLTAKLADPTAMTEWPYDMYKVGSKLVYDGKIPNSTEYGMMYLDGTSSRAIDLSGLTDFDGYNQIIGEWNNKVYFCIDTTTNGLDAYSYDGTNIVRVPGLNGDSNDFNYGVEWNGALYFRQDGMNPGSYEDGVDALYKLQNDVVTPVNYGDANNPVFIQGAEPRAVFNGKLYVDGEYDGDTDRYLLELTANGVTKITATIDYYGTPTLRAMPWASSAFVFNNAMYFNSNYQADGLQDASWNGQNGDRSLFKMTTAGVITRLDPVANDPFTGGKDLTNQIDEYVAVGSTLYFQTCITMTNACSIYKVDGESVRYVDAFQGLNLRNNVVFQNKLYFGSGGKYVGDVSANNSQTWLPQIGTLDAAGTYTMLHGAAGFNRYGSLKLFNNGLLYGKPDADPRTKDEIWFTDGTTHTKVTGASNAELGESALFNNKLYFNAYIDGDTEVEMGRLTVIEGAATPVTPVVPNPEDPNVTSVTESKSVKATYGSVVFTDGSGFYLDSKGRLFSKISSKFLTSVSGTIVVSYKVGSSTKSYTCKVKAFGSVKKLKKALTKKVVNQTKVPCQLPSSALSTLKTKNIVIKSTLVVKRYTSNTGLAKTSAGKVIKPVTRKMTVTIGKVLP